MELTQRCSDLIEFAIVLRPGQLESFASYAFELQQQQHQEKLQQQQQQLQLEQTNFDSTQEKFRARNDADGHWSTVLLLL